MSEIVMDANGTTLYSRSADLVRPPASIAKIMTLYMVFDALDAGKLRLRDRIKVSGRAAAQEPSRLGVTLGKSVTVEDAIGALTVKSANDVAVAVAEKLATSEGAFAQKMTRRARSLGLRRTTFGNATGLPDKKTRTTARDVARLCVALLRDHPKRYSYFSKRTLKWSDQRFANHNRLLGKVKGVDGVKTGFTVSAGFTLAASAKRNGRRLVAVVLGEDSRQRRDARMTTLLEAGFEVLAQRERGNTVAISSLLAGKRLGVTKASQLR